MMVVYCCIVIVTCGGGYVYDVEWKVVGFVVRGRRWSIFGGGEGEQGLSPASYKFSFNG